MTLTKKAKQKQGENNNNNNNNSGTRRTRTASATFFGKITKVCVSPCQAHIRPSQSCRHPLVGIICHAIVVDKLAQVRVVDVVVRQSLNGTSIPIVGEGVVRVRMRYTVDLDASRGRKACGGCQ